MQEFSISTNVFFGEGALDRLKEVQNKNVMIICDSYMVKSGMVDKLTSRLQNCQITIFSDVVPDPPVETVAKGMLTLKNCGATVMIALGGGSAMDAAKAIRDYAGKLPNINIEIEECFAIPTTSGSGSEVTKFAVITNAQEGLKYAMTDDALTPMIAILDPELVSSVPDFVTADTGMDVLTHAIEAFVATSATDFSDALAEKAAVLVMENLVEAYKNGGNLVAREKMHNASCLAGMAFNAAGLGITHSLAHAIGGKLHIPHGRSNAMILPYIIEFNADLGSNTGLDAEYSNAALKYQKLAQMMGMPANNVHVAVSNLIRKITDMQRIFKQPSTLKEQGADMEAFEAARADIINAAMGDVCTTTNPRKVTEADFDELLKKIAGTR